MICSEFRCFKSWFSGWTCALRYSRVEIEKGPRKIDTSCSEYAWRLVQRAWSILFCCTLWFGPILSNKVRISARIQYEWVLKIIVHLANINNLTNSVLQCTDWKWAFAVEYVSFQIVQSLNSLITRLYTSHDSESPTVDAFEDKQNTVQ